MTTNLKEITKQFTGAELKQCYYDNKDMLHAIVKQFITVYNDDGVQDAIKYLDKEIASHKQPIMRACIKMYMNIAIKNFTFSFEIK